MRETNLATSIRGVVRKLNKEGQETGSSVHLTVSPSISRAIWGDVNLAHLIRRFLSHMSLKNSSSTRIHVSICKRKKMLDMENFFAVSPQFWIHLKIESRNMAGLEDAAIKILYDLGYRCDEWVGLEDSDSQLGAFHLRKELKPKIIAWFQNRKRSHRCEFLIPVNEEVASQTSDGNSSNKGTIPQTFNKTNLLGETRLTRPDNCLPKRLPNPVASDF